MRARIYGEYVWGHTSIGPFQTRQMLEGKHPFYTPYPPIAGVERFRTKEAAPIPEAPLTAIKERKEGGLIHQPYPPSNVAESRKAVEEVTAHEMRPKFIGATKDRRSEVTESFECTKTSRVDPVDESSTITPLTSVGIWPSAMAYG